MKECSNCGSTDLKRYRDEQIEYDYCLKCGQSGTVRQRIFEKRKSDA